MHSEEMALWMLEIAILLASAKLVEAVITRLGLSRVVAYVLVGVAAAIIMDYKYSSIAKAFAILGIVTLLFHAGMESSLRTFVRSFKRAGAVAVGGVVGALIAGFLAIPLLNLDAVEAFALGVVLSATSVSITVKTFEELNALYSTAAQTVIGAAVVDDVLGLALLSTLIGVAKHEFSILRILEIVALAFAFWFATAYSMNVLAKPMFKKVMKLGIEAGTEAIVLALLLTLAFVASMIGLSAILLAYALGLGLTGFRYLARKLSERIKIFDALFSPLFFVYAGTLLEMEVLMGVDPLQYLYTLVIIVALGFASKVLGCGLTARVLGCSTREAIVIGFGMVPRAEVMLTAATLALEQGVLSHHVYASLLAFIPISLIVSPIAIRKLYATK